MESAGPNGLEQPKDQDEDSTDKPALGKCGAYPVTTDGYRSRRNLAEGRLVPDGVDTTSFNGHKESQGQKKETSLQSPQHDPITSYCSRIRRPLLVSSRYK